MNTKLCRILDEIKKTEEKIAAWQGHLEELNFRKKQLEDAEIIKSIRSMKLGSQEMLAFLESIQNGTLDARQDLVTQTMQWEENMPGEAGHSREPEKEPAEREDGENEELEEND